MDILEAKNVFVEDLPDIESLNPLGESMYPDAHLKRRGIKDSLYRRQIERGTYSSPNPSSVNTALDG